MYGLIDCKGSCWCNAIKITYFCAAPAIIIIIIFLVIKFAYANNSSLDFYVIIKSDSTITHYVIVSIFFFTSFSINSNKINEHEQCNGR